MLFQRVAYHSPRWASVLKSPPQEKVKLAWLPTPIHRWNIPGLPSDFELYIKRDDYTGGEISGNKARKLEFLLADAKKQEADCVVTIGGVQSNHCRATAVAARMMGMESHLILRAGKADRDPGLVGNLMVERSIGASIHLVTKEEYSAHGSQALLERVASELRAQGRKPYVIPVGGSNGLGTWGYLDMVQETQQQLEELNLEITDIAAACGSGSTTAGMALGVHLSGYPSRVHAYMACDNVGYFSEFIDQSLWPSVGLDQSGESVLKAEDVISFHNSKGAGYAMSSDEDMKVITEVARSSSVLLDPVYTGKAVALMLRQMRTEPEVFRGKKVLFVHTGGLLGQFDKEAQMGKVLGLGSAGAGGEGAMGSELAPCSKLLP